MIVYFRIFLHSLTRFLGGIYVIFKNCRFTLTVVKSYAILMLIILLVGRFLIVAVNELATV